MNPRIQSALSAAAESALMHFGTAEQINATIEELGECIAALSRLRNGIKGNTPANRMQVVDELADVTIMTAQMRLIFGEEIVESRILVKLEKLAEHIRINTKGKLSEQPSRQDDSGPPNG